MTFLFSTMAPSHRLYQGKNQATTVFFWYLAIGYCLLFFTNNGVTPFEVAKSNASNDPRKSSMMWGADYNETHIAACLSGMLVGLALRKRIKM